MDVNNLKYNVELMKTKSRLEKELNMINREVDTSQRSCNHISTCLGWSGPFQYRDTSIHLCLLCGEYDPDTKYKIINATNYKRTLYGHGDYKSERDKRLLELQTLAIEIMSENPSITEEELIERLDTSIKREIEETDKLEKQYGLNFSFK